MNGAPTSRGPVAETDGTRIHRCGTERVNWYLIETTDGLSLVDCGFPSHWRLLRDRLRSMNRELEDIDACLLTHAQPDHRGFAARLRTDGDVPVYLHGASLAGDHGEEAPPAGMVKHLWRPGVLRYFIEVVRSGGLSAPPVPPDVVFEDGDELAVPGSPVVIHTPGHTAGHCAFYLPEQGAVFTGDALVTVDIRNWRDYRPQLFPAWANADPERAEDSLGAFRSIGEATLLPGHGDPWRGDMAVAVDSAMGG